MSSRPSRGAARLAAILDALPDALVLVNANGTVVNANTIALEAFEAPGTALVGRGLLDLLPEFDSKLIPGSMRRPDHMDPRGQTRPTRMIARRTDGVEFPVEVTSANLENGQQAYDNYGYGGDELLMLVVRDLTGTVDTEAELARSQRQTEMILRAAAEGVVGTDTDGRIVLVNPAAAQILGYRASDLGGRELHDVMLHSRADGTPFPYAESPLADTLRSGRKHRVRGQVVWSKKGDKVSVDLTTAPVRDGDQLVGAVMTFTDRRPYDQLAQEKDAAEKTHAEELERLSEDHASELTALRQQHVREIEELQERHEEELAAGEERYASLGEREKDRYEALAGRHEQLLTLLGASLRGPLDELRRELATLAADDAGQLWPEANQVLHHLSAGYSRITQLIDNVLAYQRLDAGTDGITRTKVMLDAVVAAGVDGAVELIGPGRVQFAVHAPPIEAEVDPQLLARALAHLVADVAGVDATGNSPVSAGGYMDNTVVVAAAQRGEVVRIEVRGPYAGGDPVHEPIVRGIVRAHGGVLQTHEVPGMSGNAYVLEVPIGGGAGAVPAPGPAAIEPAPATDTDGGSGGRRRARRSSVDAFLEAEDVPGGQPESGSGGSGGSDGGEGSPTGRRRRRTAEEAAPTPAQAAVEPTGGGTGRRRGRPAEGAGADVADGIDVTDGIGEDAGAVEGVSEGAVVTAAEYAAGTAAVGSGLGGTVPPQGVPGPGGGRRARRDQGSAAVEQHALPPALPAVASGDPAAVPVPAAENGGAQPTGRRRRALAAANERAAAQEAAPRAVFALPPAEADRGAGGTEGPGAGQLVAGGQVAQGGQVPGQPVAAGQVGPAGQVPGQAAATGQVPGQAAATGQVPGQAGVPAQAAGAQAGAAGQGTVQGQTGGPAQVPGGQVAVPGPVPGGQVAVPAQVQGQIAVPGQVPGQVAVPRQVPGQVPGQVAVPGQVPGGQVAVPGGQVAVPGQVPGQVAVPGQVPGQGSVPVQVPGVQVAVQVPGQAGPVAGLVDDGRHDAVPHDQSGDHTPPQPHPASAPTGRRRRAVAQSAEAGGTSGQGIPAQQMTGQVTGQGTAGQGIQSAAGQPVAPQGQAPQGQAPPVQAGAAQAPQPAAAQHSTGQAALPAQAPSGQTVARQPLPAEAATGQAAAQGASAAWSGAGDTGSVPANVPQPAAAPVPPGTALPSEGAARAAQPLPEGAAAAAAPVDPNSTQGRAISVRTLGQGVPFTRQAAQVQQPQPQPTATPAPHQPGGGGRRRKLGTPPDPAAGRPHPTGEQTPAQPQPSLAGQSRLAQMTEGTGRSYAIGAPDENAAEGPEPLDGPGGAVEVADPPRPQPMDDELPPEPLDNPRRLLVWPAPDVTTQQALSDRGYRPVIVHSREEVDAQIAAFPAALFVDPLTGPITRTALQSLRQAAVAASVPVMVTAGLGQATREAAYGADPAVLLKALAPRDSEQHPPRVLLIEEHAEIALALTATLERRGMQVARAASDADAVTLAGQFRPNLVVMDLLQVHRRQAGIVDWLRANGQLNRTPLVVYTAAVDQADLPRLASGETVLFLAERSTSAEVQARIVDLLARIGTN
ncbi:PAS domain-containing protein [Streptomyces sp. S.PB5]|uniref:PAS domain-containing protein n=1 Tax=Streptomyces sp. S.PB5 TaxID=3020844 RepID=UPI0025AEF505|nr:PAS domain-containing protein [Streptomyces sp. S.PB5]MDN3023812.1 PAS domain-containing protein [Streptomyces sp. S.PB5]